MTVLLSLVVGLLALGTIIVVLDRAWPRAMSRLALRTQRALGGFRTASIPIPGFDITYLDGGSGEPLVLVHGIGADKDHFAPIAPYVRGLGRIIVPDLPGFGDSTKAADADYSIEKQVERLGQFLDALGLRSVHLGGSSLGGAIVLAFAILHPERVQSLWLLAPAGVGGAKESEMFRLHRERGEYALFAQTPAEYARVMTIVFARPPFVPYCVRHELTIAANRNFALHTRIFRDLVAQPFAIEEMVTGVAIPTLIVWGDRDQVLDVTGAEILHRALVRSELVVMPGIGHLPMLEAPRPTAAAYRAFRASLSGAGEVLAASA